MYGNQEAIFTDDLIVSINELSSVLWHYYRRYYQSVWGSSMLRYILAVVCITFVSSVAQASGSAVQPKVIGGVDAAPGAWPSTVGLINKSIIDAGDSVFDAQFCGGTLIASNWVVTAAHCLIAKSASEVLIYEGSNDLAGGGSLRAVTAIVNHHTYDKDTLDSDIALLQLEFSGTPGQAMDIFPGNPPEGTVAAPNAWAVGWGVTDVAGNIYAVNLQEVELPIVSTSDCQVAFGGGITDNMLCAGYTDIPKDVCFGDSGGPLMVLNETSGNYELVGLTSFGNGCAETYGVYTRLNKFIDWINQFKNGEVAPGAAPIITPGSAGYSVTGEVSESTVVTQLGVTNIDGDSLSWSLWEVRVANGGIEETISSIFRVDSMGKIYMTAAPSSGDHILYVKTTDNNHGQNVVRIVISASDVTFIVGDGDGDGDGDGGGGSMGWLLILLLPVVGIRRLFNKK